MFDISKKAKMNVLDELIDVMKDRSSSKLKDFLTRKDLSDLDSLLETDAKPKKALIEEQTIIIKPKHKGHDLDLEDSDDTLDSPVIEPSEDSEDQNELSDKEKELLRAVRG